LAIQGSPFSANEHTPTNTQNQSPGSHPQTQLVPPKIRVLALMYNRNLQRQNSIQPLSIENRRWYDTRQLICNPSCQKAGCRSGRKRGRNMNFARILGMLALGMTLWAADSAIGTWKLDVAKSKYT